MARTIDEKIVEMRFDNKDFEKNVSESMSTIDKLKSALNFSGVEKAFSSMSSAADKVSFGGLSDAIDNVSSKFSALETIAVGALMNIGSRLSDLAINTAKELTIEPITEGFDKYASKTQAVQMIMNATGMEIDDVSKQLERLNWYTDETSYDFVEMVNSIGKFTAAGIELDKAVTSMQGIANWAGISGANKAEANRAMYNISQALSGGFMRAIDWKSIENANMATKEFKEMTIQAALARGTLQEAIDDEGNIIAGYINKSGNFEAVDFMNMSTTLTEGRWLTNEVLTDVLDMYGKFSNELSEVYADISENSDITTSQIIKLVNQWLDGTVDMEQAMAMTGKSAEDLEVIFRSLGRDEYALGRRAFAAAQEAKTFREAVDATKDAVSTGWMNTFELLFGNYEEAKVLWTDLANELWNIFAGPISDMNDMLLGWRNLGKELGRGGRDDFIEGIKNIYRALRSVIDPIKEAWDAIFEPLTSMDLVNIIDRFEDFTSKLILTEDTAEEIYAGFEGIFKVFKLVGDILRDTLNPFFSELLKIGDDLDGGFFAVFGQFGDWLSDLVDRIRESDKFIDFMNRLQLSASILGDTLHSLFRPGDVVGIFEEFGGGISGVAAVVIDAFKDINRGIGSFVYLITGNGEVFSAVEEINKKLGMTARKIEEVVDEFELNFGKISDIFKPLLDTIKTIGSDFFEGLIEIFGGVGDAAGDAIDSFNDWLDVLKDMIKTNPELADFVNNLKDGVQAVADFATHILSLKGAVQIFKDAGGGLQGLFAVIDERATYILDSLFDAIEKLFGVDLHYIGDNIMFGLHAIGEGILWLADLIAKTFGWEDNPFGKMLESSSGALNALKEKIKELGNGKGISISGVFSTIGSAIQKLWGILQKAAPGLAGLLELIGKGLKWVFDQLSRLTLGEVLDIAKVASLIYLVVNFSWVLGEFSEVLEALALKIKADALKSVATAILMIAGAGLLLATIPQEKMSGVLTGLAVGFGGLITALFASKFASPDTVLKLPVFIISLGIAMASLAKAVSTLAGPVKEFAAMNLEELAKGFGFMAVGLGELVGAILIVGKLESFAWRGAAAIAKIASAMLLLWAGLELFKLIDWDDLLSSLGKMAALLGVIGGITLLGEFFNTLVNSKNIFADTTDFASSMMKMAEALLVLSGALYVIDKVDNYLESLLKLAAALAALTLLTAALSVFTPTLIAFGKGIEALGKGLLILTIATALFGLLGTILDGFIDTLVDTGVDFVIKVLNKLEERMPELMDAITGVVIAFITELGNAFAEIDPEPFLKGAEVLGGAIAAVLALKWFGPSGKDFLKAGWTIIEVLLLFAEILVAFAAIGYVIKSAKDNGQDVLAHIEAFSEVATAIADILLSKVGVVLIASAALMKIFDKLNIGAASAGALGSVIVIIAEVSAVIEAMALIFTALGVLTELIDEYAPNGNYTSASGKGFTVDMINKFGDVLVAIADAVGGLIGHLLGGVFGGIAENTAKGAISGFADGIEYLAEKSGSFVDLMKGFDETSIAACETFVEMILTLTKANFLAALPKLLSGGLSGLFVGDMRDFSKFGDSLEGLGAGVCKFAEKTQGLDPASVEKASTCAGIITALAKDIPVTSRGLLEMLWEDKKDFGIFGEQLAKLGEGLLYFQAYTKGLDSGLIGAATACAGTVAALAKDIPATSRSVISWIFDDKKDLGIFGEQLPKLGEGLMHFQAYTKNLNVGLVTTATFCAKTLAELAADIPVSSGSWWDHLWKNDNSLSSFGSNLKSFGKGFKDYYDEIEGINAEKLKTLTQAISDTIDAFGKTDEVGLANKVKEIADKVLDGIANLFKTDDAKEKSQTAGGMLIDYIAEKFVDPNSIANISNSVSELITQAFGAEELKEQLKLASIHLVEGIQNGIDERVEAEDGPKSSFRKFLEAITTMLDNNDRFRQFYEAGKKLLNSLGNGLTFQDNIAAVKTAFGNFLDSLCNGIATEDRKNQYKAAGTALGGAVVSGMSSQEVVQETKNAGTYITAGLVQGITESSAKAKEAAKKLAKGVPATVASELSIKSPSVVMKLLGMFVGEGFANGIWESIPNVEEKVHDLSQSVLNGITNSDLVGKMKEIGILGSGSFAEGLASKLKTLFDTGDLLGDTVDEGVLSNIFSSFLAGEDIATYFQNGLTADLSGIYDAGQVDLEAWSNSLLSGYDLSYDAAEYDASGAVAGLASYAEGGENAWYTQDVATDLVSLYADSVESNYDVAYSAGENLFNATWDGILGSDWNSAQKAVADRFGLALDSMSGYASDPWFIMTGDDLDAYNNEFQAYIQSISDTMSNTEIEGPTIRPVVDYDDFYRANDAVSGTQLSYGSSYDYRMNSYGAEDINNDLSWQLAAANQQLAEEHKAREYAESKSSSHWEEALVSEFREFRGDMAEYNDNVTNMQLVMDTGALVGATASSMDKEMGTRWEMSKRGI